MKIFILTVLLGCLRGNVFAQISGNTFVTDLPSDSFTLKENNLRLPTSNGKKWVAGGLAIAGAGGSLLFLTYSNNYEAGKDFKTINDARVWLQMDKAEHFFLAFSAARFLTGLGSWAGFPDKKSVILGSGGSLLYLTTKEILDGHNVIPQTGWSWVDMGANTAGIALFASQQLAWQEQKIQLKFSALPKRYEPDLNARADNLFGGSKPERLLKDHNAQTFWLSFNLKALSANQNLPGWLNLAVGYGASNMFGQTENVGYSDGTIIFDRSDLQRYRQWYISPDIDLTKLKTTNRLIKTLLFTLNTFKVPLPALELSNNKFKGHWLHY